MAKTESTFVNMVLTLLVVALAAGASLGFIYQLTEVPIALAKLEKKKVAVSMVVPEFDNDPIAEMYKMGVNDKDSLELFPARKNGKLVGVAVKTFTKKGFSGEFWIMAGFTPDGTIYSTAVLEHKETPGLGDKMEKKKNKWSYQFDGFNPAEKRLNVKQDNGDVDAITAATISSRAFCDAVQRAHEAFLKSKDIF